MLVCVFMFTGLLSTSLSDDVSSDENECVPQMADVCFHGYFKEIQKVRNHTTDASMRDLCKATRDRINCAQDVINSDCTHTKGKSNFDSWMDGLNIVHTYLCENSFNSMRALWQTTTHGLPCWHLEQYLTCVENRTRITHVLDMLEVRMDVNECNYILIAMSTCSTSHTLANEECEITKSVLDEILHLFIQKSKCSCRYFRASASRNFALNSKDMICLFVLFIWLYLTKFI